MNPWHIDCGHGHHRRRGTDGIGSWPSMQASYNDLKYPVIAKKAGIEGRVVIQVVVEIDGSVS